MANQPLLWTALIVLFGLNAFALVEIREVRMLLEANVLSPRAAGGDGHAGPSGAKPVPGKASAPSVKTAGHKVQPSQPSESTRGVVAKKPVEKRKRRPPRDPCQEACDALGNCSLESDVCAAVSTRSDHLVRTGCMDACRAQKDLANGLEMARNCKAMTKIARAEIKGFSSICGQNHKTP